MIPSRPDPTAEYRMGTDPLADAVYLAGVIEATSQKVGNVHPDAPFEDLTYQDFTQAAAILAQSLSDPQKRLSDRMFDAVQTTIAVSGRNVNLGIVLLVGPLFESVRQDIGVDDVLRSFNPTDGGTLMRMIAIANPRGLGAVAEMDVHDVPDRVDILDAMRLAEDRDRVARQYSRGFDDIMNVVVPTLRQSFTDFHDVHRGVVDTQIQLLARWPDSLIARKCGADVAEDVRQQASSIDASDADAVARFDASLRTDDHRYNPGTTADLIAAALFQIYAPRKAKKTSPP